MSILEQQLKEIQKKLEKVKLYKDLLSTSTANLKDASVEFPTNTKEIIEELTKFVELQIAKTEGLQQQAPTPSRENIPEKNTPQENSPQDLTPETDPLKFITKYKHLVDKEITFTLDGKKQKAKVLRLSFPACVIVQTESGVVKIPLSLIE